LLAHVAHPRADAILDLLPLRHLFRGEVQVLDELLDHRRLASAPRSRLLGAARDRERAPRQGADRTETREHEREERLLEEATGHLEPPAGPPGPDRCHRTEGL